MIRLAAWRRSTCSATRSAGGSSSCLADGELASGAVSDAIRAEFGITQPAVSQHLRVLRDSGFATVRPDGARRLYAVRPTALRDARRLARALPPVLDSPTSPRSSTELARGRRTAASAYATEREAD